MITKEEILDKVKQYISERKEEWEEGDWVSYSGPHYDFNEYCAAVESLLDGWLIFGKKSREFEKQFPKFLGKKYGILTNSGSSANLLMYSAAKSKNLYNFKQGTKIITPIVCFPTTINPIIQNGWQPIFVDVEIPSLNLDLNSVEELLKKDKDIRGIAFAHVLGNPPDMDRLMSLVDKYNLVFFEDACDALGSLYKGKKLGSFGHISTCSFFPAHHMTMGEGGFVATNDPKIRKVLTSIRDWGRACYCNTAKPGNVTSATACGNRFKEWLPGAPDITYDHRYVFDEIGYNLKPLELQAAMGLSQLEKLPEMDNARRDNYKKLSNIFDKYKEFFYINEATEGSDPNWFAFLLTVRENSHFSKHEFVSFLEKNKIQTRSYFSGNILYHPGYNHLIEEYNIKDIDNSFPNAKLATTNSFFLGTYIGLTDEKINYIEKVVGNFFDIRKNKLRVLQ